MRAWWGPAVFGLLLGCHGESVDSAGAPEEGGVDSSIDSATDSPSVDSSNVDGSSADSSTLDSSTDAGSSGDVGPGDLGACGTHRGGVMARIDGYCIDRYEVTNADYNAFLDAPSAERTNIAGCEWNTGFGTQVIEPAVAKYPRGNVDWCDAQAYCKWAGKRLCGAIGGGSATYVLYADATKSEWMNACSAGGTQTFAYAGSYDDTICGTGTGPLLPVGARPKCHGVSAPRDVIFDLTGNVSEWEDSCSVQPPTELTPCRGRGGGVTDGESLSKCASDSAVASAKSQYAGLGFRCCKSP